MADLYESIKILREACKNPAPNWINISPKVKKWWAAFLLIRRRSWFMLPA